MNTERTLANPITCSGIGLHSGKTVHMTVYPAKADSGIVFKRSDLSGKQAYIPARYDLVSETRLGTTIRNEFGVSVSTIEHLMAALWGAGIDNAVIELDAPEVPIMDGSSEPFTFMLDCAGIVKMAAPRRVLRVLKTVQVQEGGSIARVSPLLEGENGLVLNVEIAFDHAVIGSQKISYDFREITFKQSLSRARTFGFEHEVDAMREMGLARGGSLQNAIVVGKEKILNQEGLRYADEFVRHKALDCLGDLFLAGMRIDGEFSFLRPGHGINNKLLRALFSDASAYVIESAEPTIAPYIPAAATSAVAFA